MKGYGWCFRKQGYLNVGYGRQDRATFGHHLRAFVAFLAAARRVPARALERWQGHAYLLYGDHARAPVRDGALLIGDAAGLAYAQSGEGIRTAVESGLLAARAILDARGDYAHTRLLAYERALEARFGPGGGSVLSQLVPEEWVSALGSRLLASGWLTRRVLLDRWFFHRHQAALVA
jgi:flavin-dependent dehydrogenase